MGVEENELTLDELNVEGFPIQTKRETLISGENLFRGTPLGKITASGKLTQLDSGASDGSETPYAILLIDTDASLADTVTDVYVSGAFNKNVVDDYLATGDTIATFIDGFRDVGIYIKDVQRG